MTNPTRERIGGLRKRLEIWRDNSNSPFLSDCYADLLAILDDYEKTRVKLEKLQIREDALGHLLDEKKAELEKARPLLEAVEKARAVLDAHGNLTFCSQDDDWLVRRAALAYKEAKK